MQDKVGAVIIPGSKQVLDRATGKLVDCTPDLPLRHRRREPCAVRGVRRLVRRRNNAAATPKKDAAYAFLSYMSAPEQSNEDVTIGITGFNPYRTSQFENLDLWIKAGMSKEAAEVYLGAIKDSLNSPNMVLDLRVPQNQRYQQVVLDTAVGRIRAGELPRSSRAVRGRWVSRPGVAGLMLAAGSGWRSSRPKPSSVRISATLVRLSGVPSPASVREIS